MATFFFANGKNVRMYFYSNSTVILRVSTKYSARQKYSIILSLEYMISPAISESPITRKREGRGEEGGGEERGNPRDIIIVSYPRHKLAVKYRETIRMLASVLYAFQQEALGTSSEDIPRQRSNNAAISFSTEEAYRTTDRIGA